MPSAPLLKLAACLALVIALLAGWHQVTKHYDRQGYDRAKEEDKTAADQQAERNRELMRQAELRYVVKREAQDRYFVETVREVHDAAAPLAACPLPDRLRVRVNDAIACAVGNPSATCGAAGEVPGAAEAAGRVGGQ